jgi:transcriptional regulator with XRE-family HTH domain
MELRESTARTRELGAELRKAREAARYTGQELAKKLGWSQSKVSRMESGSRGTSEVDAAIYLAFCGIMGNELHRILDIARARDDDFWLHHPKRSSGLRSLVAQETTAEKITYYEPLVLPGLLQTEDYARALFHGVGIVPADKIPMVVERRMNRQALLRRENPPKIWFFVHENALRLDLADDRIMHEQILHILLSTAGTAVPAACRPCRLHRRRRCRSVHLPGAFQAQPGDLYRAAHLEAVPGGAR